MPNKPDHGVNEEKLVRATIAEALPNRDVSRERVLARLVDWKLRTHNLYDSIQRTLGDTYTFDRIGKQESREELVQRAKLKDDEVPKLDILRVEKPAGILLAQIVPRGLWIIGANGRLDLRIVGPSQKQAQYFLTDKSEPLSGEDNARWFISTPSNRLEQQPFTEQLMRSLIGASHS